MKSFITFVLRRIADQKCCRKTIDQLPFTRLRPKGAPSGTSKGYCQRIVFVVPDADHRFGKKFVRLGKKKTVEHGFKASTADTYDKN